MGGDENAPVHEQGLGLQGAWVTGALNLDNATLPKNLQLINSYFDTAPTLIRCTIQYLNLSGCYVNGLDANDLVCSASVFLDNLLSTGEVSLNNAKIGGQLQCNNSEFKVQSGDSLNFDNAEIKGSVFLNNINATGVIRLMSAQITGGLECHAARFENGLNAENAVISGSIYLNGNDDLTKKFISHGTISFLGTQIGGDFCCKNSEFAILGCRRAIIKGTVVLRNFIATEPVVFTDSQIGELDCEQGEFNEGLIDNAPVSALNCEAAVIKRAIVLINVTANGVVSLSASRIGSDLVCQNTNFNGNGEYALLCEAAVISGKVVLGEGFSATGMVSLARTMTGNLDCNGGTINGKNEKALNAEGLTVAHLFHVQKMKVLNGHVSLMAAKVGTLSDDADSWSKGQLILNGFVYEKLGGVNVLTDAKSRIEWLEKQTPSHLNDKKEFKPQPWQQLQKVLREMGHIEDARQVGIAFEDRLRKANLIGQTDCYQPIAWIYQQICCFFHWCFGWLIGYGYRPLRLFIIMLGIWLACGGFYWSAALYGNQGDGVFAPSNPLVFQNPEYAVCVSDSDAAKMEKNKPVNAVQGAGNWYLCEKLREEYTGFSPLAYSLDLILPLVDLQQEHDWSPMIPTPKSTVTAELSAFSLKRWTRFVMWFEILFGWMASLLLVVVISGLTKRRDE